MSEQAIVPLLHRSSDDFARIFDVWQIVGGEHKCHCGEDAVLIVDTEPDNEPGPTCFAHAMEWVNFSTNVVRQLFGPKESPA